jgi:hypothetical protein
MTKLNSLLSEILAETKRQENKRQEYLSLVNGIINGTTKENEGNTWRINFRWYSDKMGGECISFSSNIVKRNNEELANFQKKYIEESDLEIAKAVNYMIDCGEKTIDAFINHLSKVVLPQFLQNRYPSNYEISRNQYTAMFRSRVI